MFAQRRAAATSLSSDEFHFLVFQKIVEDTDRVRSSPDASDDGVGKFAFSLPNLDASFASDDAMKIAHHGRIGMRAENAAQQVVRGANVGDPVAHGFVDGVLEGARTGIDAANFGAEQTHAEDVKLLAAHILGAHVDHALESKQRADSSRRDAVLSGAGFRDDAVLAHPFDKQGLPEAVIDL